MSLGCRTCILAVERVELTVSGVSKIRMMAVNTMMARPQSPTKFAMNVSTWAMM